VIVRTVLAAAAAILVAVAIGCGGDDSGGDGGKPLKIRMGWGIPAEEIKYVMMHHPQVAKNLGTAYEVEWHQFAGTAPGVQGLAAGTIDCATVGGLSVANGLDRGADIVLLGEFIEERRAYASTTWMVRKDAGIDTPADLKGKTVAAIGGGSTDYLHRRRARAPDGGLLPDARHARHVRRDRRRLADRLPARPRRAAGAPAPARLER
jgi:ABC-type nitrate/sulfonate/bicarbonate transport system substrate-binding protein